VACLGEQADGHKGDAPVPIIARSRVACPDLESVGADQRRRPENPGYDA
jgi:hypothetical protein